jgi:thioredoxin reductase
VDTYDLAIIGGGPGGLAAAMYGAMRGLSVVDLEAEELGGQLINLYPTKPVTNFPAQVELSSGDLARRLALQAERMGAELASWEPVEHVAVRDRLFVVRTSERTLGARALVLALGLGRFTPRRLGLEGEEHYLGRGLTYRLPPLDRIDARRAVIVGGGDSAVDTALSLHSKVPEVTLVHRRSELTAYAHSQHRLEESGLTTLTNAEVVGLRGADRLETVVVSLADNRILELPADLLLVSIGQVPDLKGVASWDLGIDQSRLAVNTAMETDIQGVFAVGDFADYPGKVKMIATAVAEGSTAAASVERFLMTAV